jgi:hypothetical protein
MPANGRYIVQTVTSPWSANYVSYMFSLRVIVFSNPSHSSDIKARAAMDGGAPLG